MTKEEAKKILSGYVKACNEDDFFALEMFEYEEVIEAMTMGANALSQPSLPSNLDDAAIPETEMSEWMEYGPHTNYPWCSVPDAIKITAEHFFALGKKAGAEWMAGQGETRDDIIVTGDFDNKAHIFPIPSSKFNPGDRVIVQIRKK